METPNPKNPNPNPMKAIRNPNFPVLPNEVIDYLSSDQYYAYRICVAITLVAIDDDLELLEFGPLHNARWLTLGYSILRCYVSVRKPSLVHYLNFY